MKTLYIRFSQQKSALLEYVLCTNGKYKVLNDVSDIKTLDIKSNDQIVVFLPAIDISWHNLDIPTKNVRQKKSAIPFVLESELAQDIEKIFYDYKIQKNFIQVSVIKKSSLNYYLSVLNDLDIYPDYVLSESEALFSLPKKQKQWHILQTKQYITANTTEDCVSFYTNITPKLEGENIHYSLEDSVEQRFDNHLITIDNILVFLAQNIQLKNSFNWLDINKKNLLLFNIIKPYISSLSLILLLLLGWPLLLWLEQSQDYHHQQLLNQKMVGLYKNIYPNAKNIADPYQQLLSKTKQKISQEGHQFLLFIHSLEQSFDSNINIKTLTYSQKNIHLTFSSYQIYSIDSFKDKLSIYFKIEVKKSIQDNGKTIVTLLLKRLT